MKLVLTEIEVKEAIADYLLNRHVVVKPESIKIELVTMGGYEPETHFEGASVEYTITPESK